jgi:hypothetical protein
MAFRFSRTANQVPTDAALTGLSQVDRNAVPLSRRVRPGRALPPVWSCRVEGYGDCTAATLEACMKRNMWMMMAIACVTTITVGAQGGSSTSKSTDDKNSVTVTGCLRDDSRGAAGSTSSGGYILANAKMAAGASSSTGATAGTTPTGTAGTSPGSTMSTGSSYLLEGQDSDLKKHVGHRIEVTGTIDNTKSSEAAPPTTAGAASSTAAQRLKVSSIRMIAADCSAR